MGRYFYTVRDSKGNKSVGAEEGFNQEEVVNRLQSKELFVVSIVSESAKEAPGLRQGQVGTKLKFRHYGLSNDDLVLFCRQLATLLGAGVTILKSIDIICLQVTSLKLHNVLRKLRKDMEAGLSLHEAMSKHATVFSELWVNLVESGEASGNLSMVLARLATYLEKNESFKRKVISALIYPAILIMAGIAALLFLTIKIIPTFAELFEGFNIEMPFLTQVLLNVSDVIKRGFLMIIIAFVACSCIFKNYIKTKIGRRTYERFKFGLPIFGDFFRGLVIERFSSEMCTLVESGVPILYSLEITEHSVGNLIMSDIVHQIKDEVRAGKNLSLPLERSGFFEPMVVQMVAIGEEVGELPQMFKKINIFYQEYIETFLNRFASIFEPIVMIFMGLVIGIVIIGMFLPIFQITKISG